jgi:flagellar biosynthesis protein FlhF
MLFETFHGTDLRAVFEDARRALGEDVLVIRSHVERHGTRTRVTLVGASGASLAALKKRLDPLPPSLPRANGGRGRSGPFILALVGPTGAGKTTTLAKLAMNEHAFGKSKVGILSLDTWRVAAIEQLQQYAEVSAMPLEVAYDAKEIPAALRRLERCDVVLIDTPGRSGKARDANGHWQTMLRAAAPDETHLIVPATMRPDLLPAVVQQFAPCRPTHVLVTKIDEIVEEAMLADVSAGIDLPTRWLADGQAVPADLRPARARVLAALGIAPNDLNFRVA